MKEGGSSLKITVLAVGKVKEKFYVQAIAQYAKRLGRYCKLEIIEVADEKKPRMVPEKLSAGRSGKKEGRTASCPYSRTVM